RREGLPATSSLVESLVGEFNARVKSKQKYWTRPGGAESILQLGAAVPSEDDRLHRFFADRPGRPFRKRPIGNKCSDPHPAQTAA
ncbi:MAG: LysR family transcriptional regulator, partial [Gemmataceae bacterium]|nr:LysR family transcriptional regulator [Gemmataceae bacterium]